ncbi:MAG: AMP-binding protein [Kiritimatiellae bacterium]|nr:AMP-binding protein [Kiritimatiellia bacterium]
MSMFEPCYHPNLEFLPPEEQRRVQAGLLQQQLRYTLEKSPYYRQSLPGCRVPKKPEEVFAFLSSLPLTTRDDLARCNEAFFAAPPQAVREVVCSSGTTGRAIALPLTSVDLEHLTVAEYYTFAAAGLTENDTVLLCVTMDSLFMAGMAYYLGLQRIGCCVLRQGAGGPALQVERIRRFGVTAIMTVPSFLLAILREAEKQGFSKTDFPLRKAILVGDAVRDASLRPNAVARCIAGLHNLELYGNYGNTEMNGSLCECSAAAGHHIHPDLVHAEILRGDGSPCADGEPGALVVTSLQTEGAPLIRYRTGDITFRITEPCACGRHSHRIGPILARENQMLKIRGTTIYPAAVRDYLHGHEAVRHAVLIAGRDACHGEQLTILLCVDSPDERLHTRLRDELADAFRVRPALEFLPEERLLELMSPPGYRKKRWFIDRRGEPD